MLDVLRYTEGETDPDIAIPLVRPDGTVMPDPGTATLKVVLRKFGSTTPTELSATKTGPVAGVYAATAAPAGGTLTAGDWWATARVEKAGGEIERTRRVRIIVTVRLEA